MTFVHRLKLKSGTHAQLIVLGLPTDSCSTYPVRQPGQLILVQPIQCVIMLVYQHSQVLCAYHRSPDSISFLASVPTHQHNLMMRFNQALLPSPERCACHRSPDSSSRRFSCRWFCQVLAKMRSDSLHGVTCCTLFASLALLLLSSPVMIHHSKGFTRRRTVSTSTTNSDNCLFISILTDSGATSLQHVSNHLEVRKTPHKMWLDSGLPTDSCSTNPVRQRCKLNLVQPIQCVLLLVYQHSQVLKDVTSLSTFVITYLMDSFK